MSLRITLIFEHPTCDVGVDVHLPLPDPIEVGAEAMADRCRPACPICKEPMRYIRRYINWRFPDDDASTSESPR